MRIRRTRIPTDQTYILHNSVMNYVVLGEGKPVILIHGSMISNPWSNFEVELAKYFKVYLLHLPGFGASDAIEGRVHNTELFSIALSTFLNHEKLQNAPVIAFSLGTVVAVSAAVQGELKGKLILVGVPGKVESKILSKLHLIPLWFRRQIISTSVGRKKILMPIVRDIIGNDANNEDPQLLAEIATTDTRSLVDLHLYNDVEVLLKKLLPELKNEMICIYGEKDKLRNSTKSLVKNPIIIEGADHNPFTSQPEKTLSLIRKIID